MKIAGSKILITGGGGLIGSWVTEQLIAKDVAQITVLDNFDRGDRSNLDVALKSNRVKLVEGDICDRELVRDLLAESDALVHLAAMRITQCVQDPERARDVMFTAPFNMFYDAAQLKTKRIVAASSSSIYGQADVFPTTEKHHPFNDDTLYGASKLASEGILRSFSKMYDLPSVTMRFFNVYGPRMDIHGVYTEVMVRWLERISEGKPPIIFGDGTQSMDFTYVSDVAASVVAALESDSRDLAFNVGTGKSTTLTELASILCEIMGTKLSPDLKPARGVSPVNYRLADTRLAEEVLGFKAKVDVHQGMRQLAEYWRANKRG
ncbi:MAG: GDP-mannose 4,6-dehydratase [Novosphingobium sp.]|jgi:UDP-glucose 4-epimerase|uniref:NAD-dependent epimerase/dehydratase family protein n=1 Tax=Novosphingobium sp. TaxID=1874826 RepID=UPI0022C2C360|nr:NAD-dependent epimerase/dehydratase family protein [Novosphingobium sp.]MCZ8035942.1 GDP-mannose 4,6-dehydratase [Novosphingobium sp.]